MAEVLINHAFVTAKSESPDPSVVSASEWNAPLLIAGGGNGNIFARDATQPHGGKWIQGITVGATSANFGASGASTIGLAANTVVCSAGPCSVVLFVYVIVTTSAGQVAAVHIRRNGVDAFVGNWAGDGIGGICKVVPFFEIIGTYIYDIVITVSTGTITNGAVEIDAQVIGTI